MKRQTAIPTQKENIPSQMRGLLPHAAVRTIPEHERLSNGSIETRFGYDFSKVTAHPSTPIVSQDYSNASCPLFPQRCPFGGACHTCPSRVQAKLKVGQPGDKYEQEADRVAEQVMRMPEPQSQVSDQVSGNAQTTQIQRKCAECEDEKKNVLRTKPTVQRRITNQATSFTMPSIVNDVLSSPGKPLPPDTSAFLEPRFGHDFSQVRVHADGNASQSADAINARAYTVGRHIAFGAGEYRPTSQHGRLLLAHELAHVVQQGVGDGKENHLSVTAPHDPGEREAGQIAEHVVRSGTPLQPSFANHQWAGVRLQRVTRGTGTSGTSSATSTSTSGGTSSSRSRQLNIDVLAAEDPDGFLVRAAAQDLGTDIRVRSMDDMVSQVSSRTTEGSCVASLEIFNHANPTRQTVAGGNKVKSTSGEVQHRPSSGFSRSWLFSSANRDALHRLRGSFCCNGETRWFGCSTAGVLARGGRRTEEELRTSERRYTDYRAEFYQSVEDAVAHGATRFRAIGSVNVQSWANALCTPITAATDFNSWNVRGSGYTRTVIYGGREVRLVPQADVGCDCDTETGRISGTASTIAQMRQRARELREQALRPTYEQARSVIGREQTPVAESAEQRSTRARFEEAQRLHFEQLGETLRASVLRRAGFARGARPTTPDEALRVVALWGLDIGRITSALPTLAASTSGVVRGERSSDNLAQQQRALETALTQRGREAFMSALLEVRRDRFWNEHLTRNTIYIFPDLTGVNRFRGYTQTGSRTDEHGRSHPVYIIHISRDMLDNGQVELVVANLIHELTHTAHEPNVLEQATQAFNRDLAELLADHPQVEALRAAATDVTVARATHVSQIRQMLYDVTGYAEAEIFAHLQQLSHQPSMTIDGRAVRATDFIIEQVTRYIVQLRRIGMPTRMLAGMLGSIRRRTMTIYDRRIAATPEGSLERRQMEANKRLAESIFHLALSLSEEHAE